MDKEIKERSWVEIDLDSFRHNLRNLKRFFEAGEKDHPRGMDFLQIVKADAYGHGAQVISQTALEEGAVYLGVANCDEGKLLRIQGISAPVLILSPSLISEIADIVQYELSVTVSDLDFARALNAYLRSGKKILDSRFHGNDEEGLSSGKVALDSRFHGNDEEGLSSGKVALDSRFHGNDDKGHNARKPLKRIKIHIKIDTGMHRSGIDYQEARSVISEIAEMEHIEIEGIFSHFAASESDPDYSRIQLERFQELLDELMPGSHPPDESGDTDGLKPLFRNGMPKYIHISNSAGIINRDLSDPRINMVRLGILSFGIYTSEHQKQLLDLWPVMSFKACISQLKKIGKNEPVGYNLSYRSPEDSSYAIVPVGYADGYDYLLSNLGTVWLNGVSCPVIGKVSMDMITIDTGALDRVQTGDVACLMGSSEGCDKGVGRKRKNNDYGFPIEVGNDEEGTGFPIEVGNDEEGTGFPIGVGNDGYGSLIRAENLTARYGGSPYELLCQIGRRAKRYYISNSRIVSSAPLSRRDFVSTDFPDTKLNQIIESALTQRLQSAEIGELLSREILREYFYNKDSDIHYRRNFVHKIRLSVPESFARVDSSLAESHYYITDTELTFNKILQNDYFIVACARKEQDLNRYFKRRDVEYRWLMDTAIPLGPDQFLVTAVSINGIKLETRMQYKHGCIEILCSSPSLKHMVGKEVKFSISTRTMYPMASHQLSIFITELTQGVQVYLEYPSCLEKPQAVPVFSGQNRYPRVSRRKNTLYVKTKANEWVFPMSGIIFVY